MKKINVTKINVTKIKYVVMVSVAFIAAHFIVGIGEYHFICQEMDLYGNTKILIAAVPVLVSALFWYCGLRFIRIMYPTCPQDSINRVMDNLAHVFLWVGIALGIFQELIFRHTDLYRQEIPQMMDVILWYQISELLYVIIMQILIKYLYRSGNNDESL